jgi:hypothetical protein
MGTTPISVLAANVQSRLEEVPNSAGAWWSLQFELYSGIVEAMNDLLLLVGRPTQVVNLPFTLIANSVWQTVPNSQSTPAMGILAITDIQGFASPLYKINLWDMDYLQSSWGSGWTQDVDNACYRWCPIGVNMFAIHPAVAQPQTVNITAIAYPTTDVWPYTGNETVPFEDNFFELIEIYCSFYARIKEMGSEFQEGMKLFDQYLQGAKRMTAIQDLRDPLLFSSGYGSVQNVNPTTKR